MVTNRGCYAFSMIPAIKPEMLDRKVHLFLHVKVREKWAEERDHYRIWGLDYNA